MDNMIVWSPGVTLDGIEKQVILMALKHFRGNKTVTSNSLGIAIRTLDNKLEKYEAEEKELLKRRADEQAKRIEFQQRARGNEYKPDPVPPVAAPIQEKHVALGGKQKSAR